ncbi:MAG: AraC family transcriptional regulator [Bacteroidia bacterium]
MNSDILTLPEDFHLKLKDTLVYFYSNNKSSVKNKVVFTKNMFCMLQHGIKEVQTATGKETITNNDILILTSGSTLMSESIAENYKYEAILIFFGNKTLSDFCAKQDIVSKKKSHKNSILKILRDDFLNNFCRSLILLREQNNFAIDEFKIQEILGYLHSKHPETFQSLISQSLLDNTDIKLKQIVELNTGNGLTLEELAFLCNMSISTFKRHFADIYSMPPQKYFIQNKMERAKMLLSLHKRPSEIYPELGYKNLSAFSNSFKKHFNISPKQFLELLKKGSELTA